MNSIISAIKTTEHLHLKPFSIYTSCHIQQLLNVPIANPLLIIILQGTKLLGTKNELQCNPGQFIFLSNHPSIDMRNIPVNNAYQALLIEFKISDFTIFTPTATSSVPYFIGETSSDLTTCLQQFIESAQWGTDSIWALRRQEILLLLYHLGYQHTPSMIGSPNTSQRLNDLFMMDTVHDISLQDICQQLAMSESTLRRKLQAEGSTVQEIKDSARLGKGLHLLQTTTLSIGSIANSCGYQSQSRFADRFKKRFGLTPSELRKTKVAE